MVYGSEWNFLVVRNVILFFVIVCLGKLCCGMGGILIDYVDVLVFWLIVVWFFLLYDDSVVLGLSILYVVWNFLIVVCLVGMVYYV